MPFRFINPDFEPVEDFDSAVHVPIALSGAGNLDGGIDAWVELAALPKTAVGGVQFWVDPRPREFRVPIRQLLPGPVLAPRDPEVMAWIERHGWTSAVATAEQRWQARLAPAEYARIQRRRVEKAAEARKRDAEDYAATPRLSDEFVNQAGRVLKKIKDEANKVGDVLKWSAIGVVAIGGGLLAVRAVEAVRRK